MRRTTTRGARIEGGRNPYDHLRRAQQRDLQHHDSDGLRHLLDDYFALADELEFEELPQSSTEASTEAA
jgi:hypothetical protein